MINLLNSIIVIHLFIIEFIYFYYLTIEFSY